MICRCGALIGAVTILPPEIWGMKQKALVLRIISVRELFLKQCDPNHPYGPIKTATMTVTGVTS